MKILEKLRYTLEFSSDKHVLNYEKDCKRIVIDKTNNKVFLHSLFEECPELTFEEIKGIYEILEEKEE